MSPIGQPKAILIRGAMWHIAMRWSLKGLGFLNTVIMARLLLPSDYGIVAMAMLVVGLIQAMVDFGASTALLRKGEVSEDEINSAWSLSVIEGVVVGLLLFAAAPFAAAYFNEPRVQPVLWVLAVSVALACADNVGFVLAQKTFDFSRTYRLAVAGKIIGVLATVLSGLYFRDYRALVTGIAASYVLTMVLSYRMHPYRPRWSTSHMREIWSVTKWLMLSGMGGFVLRKSDELVAARLGGSGDFGRYNVGADLGTMPTGEIGPALLRAFLPVLSTIKDDVHRTNQAVVKAITAVNTITVPLGLGFAALATQATALVLGANWAEAAPFVAAFAVAGTLQIMAGPLNTLLILHGHTRVHSYQVWLEFVVFASAALLLVPGHFLMGLVWARMLGNVSGFTFALYSTRRLCGLRPAAVLAGLARPWVGGGLMYALVTSVTPHFQLAIVDIVVGVVVGVSSYAVWAFLTWRLVGRPEGLESTVMDYLTRKRP